MSEPDDNRQPCTYRLPKPLLKKFRETADRLSPHIRDYTHAVEVAIHEWVERNRAEKP